MKPVIALIGRPNVGKSTLFNQITKSRDALVADFAGLTRDRKYGDATYQNKSFIVVDTGGIGESEGGIDNYMAEQSKTAINEADIIIFVDTSFVSLASISAIQHERCIDFLKGVDSETKDMIVFKVKERLDSKPPIDISKYYKFFPLLILLVGTTTFTKVGVIILSVFNISIQMFIYSLFFFALLLIGIVIQDSLSKHSDDDTYKYILMLIDRSYRSGD